MLFPTNNLVTTEEAQQDFAKITRIVDECGSVVIYKNNVPCYILTELGQDDLIPAEDDEVMQASARLMEQNKESYEVLAQ